MTSPPQQSSPNSLTGWIKATYTAFQQRPWLYLASGTVGLAAIAGIPFTTAQMDSPSSASSETREAQVLPVETLSVQPVDQYQVSRSYTGEIAALRSSNLGFERSGELVQVLVEEGDRLQAGQPLAQLDIRNLETQKRQLEAQKAEAQARLLELERGPRQENIAAARAEVRDLENQLRLQEVQETRREYLYTEGAISREELDEFAFGSDALRARLDQARSDLEELLNGTRPEKIAAQQAVVRQLNASIADLEVTIAKSTIEAPFDGIVAERLVDEGTVVGAGQPVIHLIENVNPEARIGLPPRAIAALAVGSNQTIQMGDQSYAATVSAILPNVDPDTRTQIAVLTLDRSTISRINPGQTVRLEIMEQIQTEGYWLPTDALTQGIRGLWTCYVLTRPAASSEASESESSNIYELQPQTVEILHQSDNRVLVRGTLQAGDRLVASGIHRLVPGQRVRPIQ